MLMMKVIGVTITRTFLCDELDVDNFNDGNEDNRYEDGSRQE